MDNVIATLRLCDNDGDDDDSFLEGEVDGDGD